jgi:hypothetical protein
MIRRAAILLCLAIAAPIVAVTVAAWVMSDGDYSKWR